MANEGIAPNYNYDVYISFRGPDTRQGILSFLCNALHEKGLIVFTDEKLRPGDHISSSITKAIEESRILIVILSENYASSTWCLRELEKILECKNMKNQLVCPIFYKVDPSHVRHQTGNYGEAMAQHECQFGGNSEEVRKWRSALTEIAQLSGWKFAARHQSEYEFIQEIVAWITKKLVDRINRLFSSYDVFLSFSMEDTRYSFTDFLYNVLQREGFRTFRDDEKWVVENHISQSRIEAIIEQSKFSIIVFSENYAYSSHCLDAVVKILDCKKLKKQRVLPIFYKVLPSDVRYQVSHYSKAMDEHVKNFGKESKKVQKWRSALFEIANLKGYHFETGYEFKTAQKIVELVNKSLPRYDVFLSFRGRDTRNSFTGYLYYALCKKGFKTFMDDEALEGGDEISETLINAIRESKFSIVVFSENFASSSWCLDELVNILETKRMQEQMIWPIYYKVEPSDVWYQRNKYEKAMLTHEDRLGKETKVPKWRSALSEVANLEKWHFETGYEYEFIEEFVEKIAAFNLALVSRRT